MTVGVRAGREGAGGGRGALCFRFRRRRLMPCETMLMAAKMVAKIADNCDKSSKIVKKSVNNRDQIFSPCRSLAPPCLPPPRLVHSLMPHLPALSPHPAHSHTHSGPHPPPSHRPRDQGHAKNPPDGQEQTGGDVPAPAAHPDRGPGSVGPAGHASVAAAPRLHLRRARRARRRGSESRPVREGVHRDVGTR